MLIPIPELAKLDDPRRYARETGTALPVDPGALVEHVRATVHRRNPGPCATPNGTVSRTKTGTGWHCCTSTRIQPGCGRPTPTWTTTERNQGTPRPTRRRWGLARLASATCGPRKGRRSGLGPRDLRGGSASEGPAGVRGTARRGRARECCLPRHGQRLAACPWGRTNRTGVPGARSGDGDGPFLRAMFQQPEIEGIVRASAEPDLDYWRAVLRHSLEGVCQPLEEDLHGLPRVRLVHPNMAEGEPVRMPACRGIR